MRKANNAVVSIKTTRWLYAIVITIITIILVALITGLVIYFTIFNNSNKSSISYPSNNSTTSSIFNITYNSIFNISYNSNYYANNCNKKKYITMKPNKTQKIWVEKE